MRTIGEALAAADRNMVKVLKIRARWSEIAGDVIASHAEPVLLKTGRLQVLCDSPVWVQQVGLLSDLIVKRIKEVAGLKVSRVEASFGAPGRPRPQRAAPVPEPPSSLDIDPADIDRIKNPGLARLVRELARAGGKGGA
jgi:hypothetical protein